ncbi:MAG: hypothetical protein Q4C13_01180 [Clostridia bacterium]|nr:hypothetical protein [Clostridia bacterium]
MKKSGNNINLYAAYRESARGQKPSARRIAPLIPLILFFLAVAAVTVYIRLGNIQKTAALDALNRQIMQLDGEYREVMALGERSAALSALADELESDAKLAAALPSLDLNLFTQVNACAAGKFNISVYRYDESARTLEIDASAPSVNDVPELVEALRDTALFSSVQYVGYTSDTDGVYYCTVGCVLAE